MRWSGYVLYGAGQLGLMVLARYFFQWILRFASESGVGGAPLFAGALVGMVFFAFRIFDGVTDPLGGMYSDAWVRRGRQRRSLLPLSFWLPPLGMALVFAPTAEMSETIRWLTLAGGMFLFFVGYTFYAIPYWSLIEDYSQKSAQLRTRLSNVLGIGVLLATGVGFVVTPILIERFGFLATAIALAVPCSLLMLLPYLAQPKQLAQPSRSTDGSLASDGAQPHTASLFHGFRHAFANRRFLAVIVLFAGGQMSFTVMTAAAPYIAVDLLGGTKGDVALLLGPFLLTTVVGFVAAPRLVARMGWERTTLLATLALGVVYAGSGLLGYALVGTALTTAMLVFATGGPMAAILLGLEGEAITTCASESEGEVTSSYFGVYNFVTKSLNGLALYLTGLLSDAVQSHGTLAVRSMGFCAGALLIGASLLYLWMRRAYADSRMPLAAGSRTARSSETS